MVVVLNSIRDYTDFYICLKENRHKNFVRQMWKVMEKKYDEYELKDKQEKERIKLKMKSVEEIIKNRIE